jgi:Protein of unknown function (DUF992)
MLRSAAALAALAALAMTASSAAAQSGEQRQRPVRAGVLQCDVSAGIGLILGSTRQVDCTFRPTRGRAERYVGAIRRVGIDLGATARGVMVWSVVATARPGPASLSGRYVGASADASVGVGLGANALVGGSNRSVALQPISVGAQVGVNAALGVAELDLQAVQPGPRGRMSRAE